MFCFTSTHDNYWNSAKTSEHHWNFVYFPIDSRLEPKRAPVSSPHSSCSQDSAQNRHYKQEFWAANRYINASQSIGISPIESLSFVWEYRRCFIGRKVLCPIKECFEGQFWWLSALNMSGHSIYEMLKTYRKSYINSNRVPVMDIIRQ